MNQFAGKRRLYCASGNLGKLREYRGLARAAGKLWEVDLLPQYSSVTEFEESAPTFAEIATGKALYYAQLSDDLVFGDDSGLVVPFLGGAPGIMSARYAGPGATNEQRIAKLLADLRGASGGDRAAHFVCVIASARKDRLVAVVSAKVEGQILEDSRGTGGFGYDPIFYFPELGATFAELPEEQKNIHSHRGKAFRRLLDVLQ
jgi:XTP/dITP diphosphohydrolase